MRIAYYSRAFMSPAGKGVHARALVHAWRRDGHEVLCLPADPGESVEPSTERFRLGEHLPHRMRTAASLLKARLCVLREYGSLRRALASFAPDIVVARRQTYEKVLDRLLTRGSYQYVAEVNAVTWRERQELCRLDTPRRVIASENAFLRRALRCACVSTEVASQVAEVGVPTSRIIVVPNGVDTRLFRPDAPHATSADARIGGLHPLLGFVGAFEPSHDLQTMAKACERVLRTYPSAGFLFVGLDQQHLVHSGFTSHVLQRTVASGVVRHQDVPGWLACADVLWAAFTHSHGSPLKLMEYMAMAKPIVAACTGQAELSIVEARCGRAVRRGDWEGLAAEACRIAAADRDAVHAMGRRGREWVVKNRDWAAIAQAMIGCCS